MRFLLKKMPACALLLLAACAPKPPKDSGVSIENPNSGTVVLDPGKGGGGANRPAFRIEWISPSMPPPGEAATVYKKLSLELRTYTTANLKNTDFKIYLDDKLYSGGSKAGEEPLIRQREEYIFRRTIELPDAPEGQRYRLRVEVNNGGAPEKSRTLIVQSTNTPMRTSIVWNSPNVVVLDGQPFNLDEAKLTASLTIYGGGSAIDMDQVTLRLNGKPQRPSPKAQLRSYGTYFSFQDEITPIEGVENQTLSIVVQGMESEPLKIRYRPGHKPNLYILTIGPKTTLRYAVNDARDFGALFKGQKGKDMIYGDVTIDSLLDAQATTQAIREKVEELTIKLKTRDISPNDLVMIFISTHGLPGANGDLRLEADDYNGKTSTTVSFVTDIMGQIADMECKKLIFLDACHSGGAFDVAGGGKASPRELDQALQTMDKYKEGLAILASSSGDQLSYEDPQWKNGAFTEAIIRGLKQGEADANGNKIITVNELYKYLETKVKDLVRNVKHKDQTPRLHNPNGMAEIPIYVIK